MSCQNCQGTNYVYPDGQPEFCEPCPKCNPRGEKPREGKTPPLKKEPPSDDFPMPFGKYKDQPLRRIRASYFLWLGDQSWITKWKDIHCYIETHRQVLEEEVDKEGKR